MTDKKPKLLWSGDIIAMTGFARVTENVLQRLADKYEIVVLGNNFWGDPNVLQDKYKIYPSSNRHQPEPFGVDRIKEAVEIEKPDLVFVMNDIWIINELYKRIADLHEQKNFKFIGYYPMDSYGWLGALGDTANSWDACICYTEFGANESIQGGIQRPISVIPHGIDKAQFYPKDKAACRKKLGLADDIFIVFNGNRNQFRKRQDITISAFADFAIDKPDARLYLHMGLKDQGWDLLPLFAREMGKRGIDPSNRIIFTGNTPNPPNVAVEFLNTIYNAVDIGVNTCKGEGHGLVSHEHAACRVAQIVPNHTSCKEIFEGAAPLIRCDHVDVDTNYGREMPCPSDNHLTDLLNELYYDRDKLKEVADKCYERATDDQYNWDNIAEQFHQEFQEVLKPVETPVIEVMEDEPEVGSCPTGACFM
jgi:glycosyltransferase involved in cell wall biosynthesis